MESLINRLGYGAWAENIIVNYIEDNRETILVSKGSQSIERDDYIVNANWDDCTLTITVRAYVEGDGWQTLEQTVKVK